MTDKPLDCQGVQGPIGKTDAVTYNKDALEALDKLYSAALESEYRTYGDPDDHIETIRAALSPVDVEELIKYTKVLQDEKTHVYTDGWNDCIDHLSQRGLICPKGYVCVPEEPTGEMMRAAEKYDEHNGFSVECADCVTHYKAMIKAGKNE